MGIYARQPWRLIGQVSADMCVLAWIVLWWLVGRLAERTILSVAMPARETAAAAGRLSGQFVDAGDQVARVPGIGSELRHPFDAAAGSLTEVVAAADNQVASVERIAGLMGWLVFLIPVTLVIAWWLPRRILFVSRARAAQRFLDSSADLDLFALRALSTQPMHVLARISDDPVTAWRSGDATVIHKLAEVELRRSGLRLPAVVRPAVPSGPTTEG